MKRRAFRVVVLLLLGAIVNVAVAWGCALWLPLPVVFSPTPIECPDTWPAYLQESWPAPETARERVGIKQGAERVGVSIIDITSKDVTASAENPITSALLTVYRFGIPTRSMQWEECGLNAGERSIELLKAAANAAGWRNGIGVSQRIAPKSGVTRRRLPLTAIWPGFAINTVFYAAMLWVVFFAPGMVKRTLRRRRGLCPACAYPIGSSPVCTECGKPIPGAGAGGRSEGAKDCSHG